jgi:hypothetical protein
MTIYNVVRGDLERFKFVTDGSGEVAVNVHVADPMPISLTGDVEIGAVELKDASSDNRAHIDTSGALDVNIVAGTINLTGVATETSNLAILQAITDGSQVISGNIGITNSSFDVNVTNSSIPVTYTGTSSVNILNTASVNVSNTASVNVVNAILSVSDSSVESQLQTINSLVPSQYDYITCSYDTSNNLTSSIFKLGGATGSTISSLAMAYDTAGNLLSVTKS